MPEFFKGDCVDIEVGGQAKVICDEPIGSGGQGEVYCVEYKGKKYALKWYTSEKIKNNAEFRKNLSRNVDNGSPDNNFLWPLFMTKTKNGSFGYLMNLIPPTFESFTNILRTYKLDIQSNGKAKRVPVQFKTMDAAIVSSLQIVKAFRELHRNGLTYQDLNDGGFFFDLSNGDILVCDCDNVAPYGVNFGIGGKPGYMAPEVVTRKSKPNADTDKFSLAVILFRLFMRGDPLEGEKVVSRVNLTGAAELEHYGTNPIFVYDPNDVSNRPVKGIHNNIINMWGVYPEYIRDAFTLSFTKGLHNSNERLIDNEWMKLLSRLRSEIVDCVCGRPQIFYSYSGSTDSYVCSKCKRSFPILQINSQKVVLNENAKLYQNMTSDSDDFKTITGIVVENKNHPGVFGIKNLTDYTWVFSYETGTEKNVGKNQGGAIAKGMKIDFGNGIIGKLL